MHGPLDRLITYLLGRYYIWKCREAVHRPLEPIESLMLSWVTCPSLHELVILLRNDHAGALRSGS